MVFSRLLACFRPRPPPVSASLTAAQLTLHHLWSLVLHGGSGLRHDDEAVLLAVASLLHSQELRVLDVKAVCTDLLAVAVSGSRLREGAVLQMVKLLVDQGADPAAREGRAIVAAVQAGRLRVAEALLACCSSSGRAVGGMSMLPMLQEAICSPLLVPSGLDPACTASMVGLSWLLARLPSDHLTNLHVEGLTLTHAALQTCATRVGFEWQEALWMGLHPQAWGIMGMVSHHMQVQALKRTKVVLRLLVAAGAPPVPEDQDGIPGLSPTAWSFLRVAATGWPSDWSQATHRRYHLRFRKGVRALLLVAHRGFPVTRSSQRGGGSSSNRTSQLAAQDSGTQQQEQIRGQQQSATVCRLPSVKVYHLPPLVIERVIYLMAARQRDWVQPS